ncbi:MAG TPA: cyclic lactone autoinducer peptide [Candidatus Aquicultor sp.]|jgi:cyclic lactone autoinducer peptide
MIKHHVLSMIADLANAASGLGQVSASFFIWYQPETPEHLKDA